MTSQTLILYDQTANLAWAYSIGAWARSADFVPVRSWEHVVNALAARAPFQGDVELFGHAAPGIVEINKVELAEPTPAAIGKHLGRDATFAFRSCAAFAGPLGKAFALAKLHAFGCAAVGGFTFNIAVPWQSGLRWLVRGKPVPTWSDDEGLDTAGKPKYGLPWSPSTVSAFTKLPPPPR